jgi:hypothetical protein
MRILLILLMALCLVVSVQAAIDEEKYQDVGGGFGRTWLNYGQAQSTKPVAQDDADLFGEDWLNTTAILGDSNLTKNNTTNETAKNIPYHIGKTFSPIHEMDASFNQSIQVPQLPQPDKYGLINGVPAEIYYALGPAYLDF